MKCSGRPLRGLPPPVSSLTEEPEYHYLILIEMSQTQNELLGKLVTELTPMRKSMAIRLLIALKKVDLSQDEKKTVAQVKKIMAEAVKETNKVYESRRSK